MINLIIWFAAFLCTNPNHSATNHGSCNLVHITVVSNDPNDPNNPDDPEDPGDTGGETGGTHHPPPPPTP
jgi:hypothetical protein